MNNKEEDTKVEVINTSTLGPKELKKIKEMAMLKVKEMSVESEKQVSKPKLRSEKNKELAIKENEEVFNEEKLVKKTDDKDVIIEDNNKDDKVEKNNKEIDKTETKDSNNKNTMGDNKNMRTVTKRKFKWNIAIAILLIVSLLFIAFFSVGIVKLNILPTLYTVIIVSILIVLFGLNCYLTQRKKGKVSKTFGVVLLVIMSLFCGFGSYYLGITNNFLSKSFMEGKDKYTNTYQVLVKKDAPYNDISELNNSKIGYFISVPNIDDALKKLTETITYDRITYDNVINNFSALDNGSVQGILTEKNLYDSLTESLSDIKNKEYKVLYSFDITFEYEVNKKVAKGNGINVYIGGPDFTGTNYDFNMIATVNKDTHKILLTSTPRDYYVEVAGKGIKDLLGYAGVWGINTSIGTIEKLYETDMNYFIKINTSSLVGLVDVLGGVEFCSNKSFTTTHALVHGTYDDTKGEKLNVKEGCREYSGIEILTIARERKAYPDGDRQRQVNCQNIMISIFKKVASLNSLTKYNEILDSVSQFYTTNIPQDVISDMAKSIIGGNNWTFEQQSVTGKDARGYVHLGTVEDYVMQPDKDSVNNAILKIREVMNES